MSKIEKELDIPEYDVSGVFGQFDAHTLLIEKTLKIEIVLRNDKLKVTGAREQVELGVKVLKKLFKLAEKGESIDHQRVKYILDLVGTKKEEDLGQLGGWRCHSSDHQRAHRHQGFRHRVAC